MAKLIFTDKNFAGRVYELMLEKTTIGRSDQNTLVIRDPSLSSAHCEILMYGSEIIVRDLDSLNGTFVDGTRLNKQSQAKSGQTVRFGSVEARLELEPGRSDTDTAEITAVYTLGKVMRDQRRAEKESKPETASMQLDPDTERGTEGQTILIPKSSAPMPSAAPLALPRAEESCQSCSIGKWVILGLLAAAGLAAAFWVLWGRK